MALFLHILFKVQILYLLLIINKLQLISINIYLEIIEHLKIFCEDIKNSWKFIDFGDYFLYYTAYSSIFGVSKNILYNLIFFGKICL